MMNETTMTLSDLSEDKQLFTEIIIEFIEKQHQTYERERTESGCKYVPLEDISFGIIVPTGIGNQDRSTGIPELQEISKIQGKPEEEWKVTAKRMLDLFCTIGEIYVYLSKEEYEGDIDIYRLSKEGRIYKHLADKLESTP